MRFSQKLVRENPVKAAALKAKKPKKRVSKKAAKGQISDLQKELKKLEDVSSTFMAIEQESINKTRKRINQIKKEIESLCANLIPTPLSLPIFDLDCLSWRDEKGLPRLVPFSIDSAVVSFEITANVSWRYDRRIGKSKKFFSYYVKKSKFPQAIAEQYKDVYDVLKTNKIKGKGIKISATFGGVIPEDIKLTIIGARKIFKNLYIVSEVKGWEFTTTAAKPVVSRQGDPLLIGWDGHDYRLIAEFDTTTVEKIAAQRSKGHKPS